MRCKQYETKSGKPIRLWQGDCMELMEGKPENHWDLAIVDPPYGIGFSSYTNMIPNKEKGFGSHKLYDKKEWDNSIPDQKYFDKLISVVENSIIWGGNYFANMLPNSRGWIYWDKKISNSNNDNFSDGELAYTTFKCVLRKFEYDWIGLGYLNNKQGQKKIHQTEKPIQLYRWLLQNYAEEGDTILDTHGGSMSLAIACYIEDFELDIIELDKDYYRDAVQRFEQHISQQTLF